MHRKYLDNMHFILDNCMVLCAVFVGKAILTSMSLELFICDSFAPIF